MTAVIRSLSAAALIAAIVSLASLFNVDTARAQPACVVTSVFNNTACDVILCLYSPAAVAPVCYHIPVGGPTGIVFPAGFNPAGVVSSGNNRYPFVAPPTPGCTRCITLDCRGGGTVCAIVCYDAPTCTIKINPCPFPCLP